MKQILIKDILGERIYNYNKQSRRKKNKSYCPVYSTIQSDETCFSIHLNVNNENNSKTRKNKNINFSDDEITINNNIDTFLLKRAKKKINYLSPIPRNYNIKKYLIKSSDLINDDFEKNKNLNLKMKKSYFLSNFKNTRNNLGLMNKKNKNLTVNSFSPKNNNLLKKKLEVQNKITQFLIKENSSNYSTIKSIQLKKKENIVKNKLNSINPRLCFPSILKDNNIMAEIYLRSMNYHKDKLKYDINKFT